METAREYVLTRCSLKAVCGVIVASRKRYTSQQEALNAARDGLVAYAKANGEGLSA